jgi:DNA-binding transcriptional LysR family regulator
MGVQALAVATTGTTPAAAVPTMNQLRCVLAVAETGSFTAGASRVHLSQPALSRSVREVERMLGVRLFERSTREVALTPDGVEFTAVASEIVENFDSGLARFRSYRAGMLGSLVVTALPSMTASVMPEVVARFGNEHPGVRVQILEAHASQGLTHLREGRAEVAVTERPERDGALARRDLCIVDVGDDEVVLAVRDDHRLVGRDSVHWSELAEESFIRFPPGTSLRTLSDRAFIEARVLPRHMSDAPSVSAAAGMLRVGLGVTAVTRSVLPLLELAHPVAIALTGPAVARPLAIVYRREPALSPAASALVEDLVSLLTEANGKRPLGQR